MLREVCYRTLTPSSQQLPHDVLSRVMMLCDLRELACLGGVCVKFAIAAYRERQSRVKRGLRPYVTHTSSDDCVADFLEFMDVHGVAITGSTALRICLGPCFVPSNLDLVVAMGADAKNLHAKIESLGYAKLETVELKALRLRLFRAASGAIHGIRNYVRDSDGLRIDVIESATPYALDAVLSHPTTLLQNFVTSDFIGCFYPQLTFERRSIATSRVLPNRAQASQFVKYRARGFSLHSSFNFLRVPCGRHCPLKYRTVSDSSFCLARHSESDGSEGDKGVVPRLDRKWLVEIEEAREFRIGSWCDNPLCSRRNVS